MRAAAADIALQGLLDFSLGRMGILPEQRHAAQDHARGAVGTLECFSIEKSLLNRMQAALSFEAFDRDDGSSGGGGNRRDARAPRLAIEQNRARPALPLAAAVLRTGQ